MSLSFQRRPQVIQKIIFQAFNSFGRANLGTLVCALFFVYHNAISLSEVPRNCGKSYLFQRNDKIPAHELTKYSRKQLSRKLDGFNLQQC